MSSSKGDGGDLWAEIRGEVENQQQPNPQIAVVYGRRRAECTNPREAQIAPAGIENRVSFPPRRRSTWTNSLSIRGRESIIVNVAAWSDLSPKNKQVEPKRKPKQGPRAKKGAKNHPDFRKEKSYFQEVDSFELLEESPSPKNFCSWAMGAQHEYSMHGLPAILERWRLLKNADRCGSSQPLATYMKTPMFPSGQSFSDVPRILSERTPERVAVSRFPLNEESVITSFDALNIKEEDISYLAGDDSIKEVEGGIKKVPLAPHPLSLGEECAFTQLLMVCRQSGPVQLSEAFSAYCDPSSIMKIGEGTYGEAYKAGETVCKVVPIDGHQKVNGEVQKKSEEVLDEVVLSLTLNNLRAQQGEKDKQNSCPCIIETKDFRVCRGAYGPDLVRAWESWDAKHGSENDHPKDFVEEQCYIVFVLADGGRDLESFVLLDFDEARSLLMQVSVALAVAEVECQFEHRDLHWGNILLNRTEDTRMNFILKGRKFSVNTFGLKVSIIDFTLSRINTGEAILFLDLSADPGLFEGPKGDTQAETYRKMKKITKECWEGSFPKTNILWLVYLVDILLTKKSFKRTSKNERDLRSFKKRLNSYESSQDCLTDNFFSDLLVAIDDPES